MLGSFVNCTKPKIRLFFKSAQNNEKLSNLHEKTFQRKPKRYTFRKKSNGMIKIIFRFKITEKRK